METFACTYALNQPPKTGGFLLQIGIYRSVGGVAALPSPGEKVARSAGCGKRETQLDAVTR